MIAPGEFIPLAEETGLIVPIGEWVLAEACRTVRAWHAQHPARPPVSVGVNLSARQLLSPELPARVADALASSGLAPHLLKLEITESAVMQDADAAIRVLQELKELGVQLAIDDFGTGYSSLSYLKRFPVDTIKIDQSFVQGLASSPVDREIVRAVIRLAEAGGMETVAEGVETPSQRDELRRLGCSLLQGYLLSRPVPMSRIERAYRPEVPRPRQPAPEVVRLP
jgi:EAL domain-containing protein (putative c-di-GMP-specific phosphodiesterase class I)